MKTPKLAVAMGYIDDELITDAIDYKPEKRNDTPFRCIVAVAACIAIVLGFNGYLKQYVTSNNIQVQNENTEDSSSCDDITPEMTKKSAKANNIHNLLVTKNLEWYSNCHYDYDSDIVKIGLTDNTDDNQKKIFEIIDDTFEINEDFKVQFYECEFSYQHLENIYNILESRQLLLRIIGVKRYNISVIDNYVNVYITSEKNYFATFVVNKLTDEDGVISFKTLSDSAVSKDGYIF